MNQLTENIKQWATDRNLITAEPHKQMLKLIEEVGEIAAGLARGNSAEVKDGIGDVKVVTTILNGQIDNQGIKEVTDEGLKELDDLSVQLMLCLLIDLGKLSESMLLGEVYQSKYYISQVEESISALANENNTTLEECTQLAWDEIKDRKGRLVDGVYVKDADLT